MFSKTSASLLLLSSLAPLVFGHSFLQTVGDGNVEYNAWDPNLAKDFGLGYSDYPKDTPAWYHNNVGGNPLKPVLAKENEIICTYGARPAHMSVPINPGSTLFVKWWMAGQPFPEYHSGPILDYIAPCNGPCSQVKPTDLRFVKIHQKGWINDSRYTQGYWATNEMIDANGTWPIRIPSGLKPGEYVVRHELIALHPASEAIGKGPYYTGGAEFYPQCVSIKVGGSGTKAITGGLDPKTFYRGDEPGLAFDLFAKSDHSDYVIPGPAVWSGA